LDRIALVAALALLATGGLAGAEEPAPPPGLFVVYAVTATAERPPVTTIWAREVSSSVRHLVYRDASEESRALLKIGSSDLLGAARTISPKDVLLLMGPAVAPDDAGYKDALTRIRFGDDPGKQTVERLLPLALSFSEESVYRLWNRAPLLAVSPDASRFAVAALRVGKARLERPGIRVLTPSGEEEWRIVLDHAALSVADLAFSPDGKWLAYLVMPLGDEHTLDQALLPKAGVYLADLTARTTRLLYPCFADAVAWGPTAGRITLGVRVGGIWGSGYAGEVVTVPQGRKVSEFSVRGPVLALAYSDDSRWLAVEVQQQTGPQIRIYGSADGWGRRLDLGTEGSARVALLGWARLGPEPQPTPP